MKRLAKAGLWLVAPTFAAWQVGKLEVSRPLAPFRRWNPKAMRWDILLVAAGGTILALAFQFDVPILGIFGVGWIFAGAFAAVARLVIPRQWVETEMDFAALTSLTSVTRIAAWVGLVASLALGNWAATLGFGAAAAGLTLTGTVLPAVALRMAANRKRKTR